MVTGQKGRRLAYKAENVTDLDSGAILSANIHPADEADTATIETSLEKARENVFSRLVQADELGSEVSRMSERGIYFRPPQQTSASL